MQGRGFFGTREAREKQYRGANNIKGLPLLQTLSYANKKMMDMFLWQLYLEEKVMCKVVHQKKQL